MPILTLTLATLPGELGMPLTGLSERLDLGIMGRSFGTERLYELYALGLNSPDGLCSSVKETLHHGGFVRTLHSTV